MAASIILAELAYDTPDGTPLFADVGLTFGPVRTGLVGRNGVGKTTLLRLISGELRPRSGRVSVNGRVAVLRQTVRPDPDQTIADRFGVTAALAVLRRAEQGEARDDELNDVDWALESRLAAALGRLGLDVPPETPLATLSGGQQTRAGLAAIVFAEPDFLLLDEPTNNLDRDGRAAVMDLLAGWQSGAIVVSHDRALLDAMDAIVELTTLGVTRYGGNWTAYRELKAQELAAAQRTLADAEKQVADAARGAQATAERQARRNGAGRRKGLGGGTPRIVLGLMKDRAEDATGGNARLAERLREQAAAAAAAARETVEILQPLTVKLPPTNLPAGKTVLRVEGLVAGYEPERPLIRDVTFAITGPERVAVTGPNGSGKTTLLAVLAGRLAPWSGTAEVMTPFTLLDQQVGVLDPGRSVRDNFRRLNPGADEQSCRAALAKFLFRSEAALQTVGTLSGGERLRAGLACVLGAVPPPFLILDEPTNHLDVNSIEAVEAGLRAYDGALLVVSHDETFLHGIGVTRRIEL
ncbi:ABC-F family ATP-binding cassette domain-containing protein [Limnoglobus roseus]|uniref:ABC transporter ATP-binding protein n=1 Tax=Limnoglobus roseus TaxID=2598579 RepID=A0A5C1AAS5_9BACT|nr:ABC-F family ATP-binding cassette domain-containing protein [Limnoglobus roseus]QEL16321.1 ABC transporter ATP-binding protein [Limnoglobus roseus]